jgi:hypothetical protein
MVDWLTRRKARRGVLVYDGVPWLKVAVRQWIYVHDKRGEVFSIQSSSRLRAFV